MRVRIIQQFYDPRSGFLYPFGREMETDETTFDRFRPYMEKIQTAPVNKMVTTVKEVTKTITPPKTPAKRGRKKNGV